MFNLKSNPKLTGLLVILAVSGVVVSKPDVIEFLPDSIEGYVKGLAGLIAAVAAVMGFSEIPKAKEVKEDEK